MAAADSLSIGVCVLLWAALAGLLLVRHVRVGASVGLLLGYVLSLAALHWIASVVYMLPGYEGLDPEATFEGLRQSVFAIAGLLVGGEIGSSLHRRWRESAERPGAPAVSPQIANLCLACATVLYGLSFSGLAEIPTLGALISVNPLLFVTGLALKCWSAWNQGRRLRAYGWLASTASFPMFTVLVHGFLGIGLGAMLAVCTFFANLRRPSWKVLAAAAVFSYLGLSVYVTYMRDRGAIRSVVWTSASLGQRIQRLAGTAAAMEWFNIADDAHLRRVDVRLNQNALVGAAVFYLEDRRTPYAGGATVWGSVVAIVPRALWPDKPDVAGSGTMVSEYTGLTFAEGTSVGVGHVLEAYINFGPLGVLVVFVVIGGILVWVERAAASCLNRGDGLRFALWYAPGLSLLNVGGSLSEFVATAAAAFLVAGGVTAIALLVRAEEPARPPAAGHGLAPAGARSSAIDR